MLMSFLQNAKLRINDIKYAYYFLGHVRNFIDTKLTFMKKLLLAFTLLAVVYTTHAQDNGKASAFGIKAGLNLSNLSTEFLDETEYADFKPGFHGGFFARVSLARGLAFQPEVLFSTEGAKESEDDEEIKFNFNYIQVPLMLQFGPASGFYGEIGPGIGFLMSAKTKVEIAGLEEEEDIKDEMEELNITGNVGIGYALENGFGVGVRYVHGFTNLVKDGNDDLKMRTRTIQVSLFKRL